MPIENKIVMGEDIDLLIKGNCVKKEIFDSQDGSVDVLFVVKPLEIKPLAESQSTF